jgi:hypothetical protein
MNRVRAYIARAEEAEAEAAGASGELRLELLSLADEWRRMAQRQAFLIAAFNAAAKGDAPKATMH